MLHVYHNITFSIFSISYLVPSYTLCKMYALQIVFFLIFRNLSMISTMSTVIDILQRNVLEMK